MAKNSQEVLNIKNLSVSYGHIRAVKGVSLKVNEGEIVALIGANGAGKTTVLRAVLGIQPADSGTILFMGRNITRASTDKLVAAGISLVPEGRGLLPLMTTMENLELGAYHIKGDNSKYFKRVFDRFPILYERRDQQAGTLSGGQQQMLCIARALIINPKLLVMDEPSLGLAPIVVNELFRTIVDLNKEGYTILLSEQNARKSLECTNRGYVFETGNIALEGTAQELMNNPAVRQAYLGG